MEDIDSHICRENFKNSCCAGKAYHNTFVRTVRVPNTVNNANINSTIKINGVTLDQNVIPVLVEMMIFKKRRFQSLLV